MQTTTNIGLKTYEAGDPTDWLGEFNYNMNKLDQAVGSQNDAIDVIEEIAGTAVTTANTASSTANQALQTANTKASIDDTVTSTTKTWSSSKINTEISAKASINDTTASNTATYSSNKINDLLDDIDTIPYTFNTAPTETRYTLTATTDLGNVKKAELTLNNLEAGYYYIRIESYNQLSTARNYCWSEVILRKNNTLMLLQNKEHSKINYIQSGTTAHFFDHTTDLIYIPENTQLIFDYYSDYFFNDSCPVRLIKVN